MNRTKIEWADYTWNPVVGCKTSCAWCYAKRLNDRFKFIPVWEEPQFYPERLTEPLDRKGAKIFVVSMGDLFGSWVPSAWIQQVIDVCQFTPQHEYMFLTKYPERYQEFDFPGNCWLGTTVENPDREGIERLMALAVFQPGPTLPPVKKFLSIEPLLGSFKDVTLGEGFDLVIVGAMTGPGAVKPEKEWIESIKHHNIFYKNNIKPFLNENSNRHCKKNC